LMRFCSQGRILPILLLLRNYDEYHTPFLPLKSGRMSQVASTGLTRFFEFANYFRICFCCSNMYKNKAPAKNAMSNSRNVGFIEVIYLPFSWGARYLIIPPNYLQPIVAVPQHRDMAKISVLLESILAY